MKGILVAIEGVDGSGKTTQVKLLGDALRQGGHEVVLSKEPTGGPWGQLIRESSRTKRLALEEEIEAFRKDRLEHVETLIEPSLRAGKIVVLDRYFYSFVAYQGARGADLERLRKTSEFAPVPDAVFLLDIDPEISVARISNLRGEKPNKFESIPALKKSRQIFLSELADVKGATKIDATLSIDEIRQRIWNALLEGVLKEKRCFKRSGGGDPLHRIPRMAGEASG